MLWVHDEKNPGINPKYNMSMETDITRHCVMLTGGSLLFWRLLTEDHALESRKQESG